MNAVDLGVNLFVALFALLDPIGNVPIFAAATAGASLHHLWSIAVRRSVPRIEVLRRISARRSVLRIEVLRWLHIAAVFCIRRHLLRFLSVCLAGYAAIITGVYGSTAIVV